MKTHNEKVLEFIMHDKNLLLLSNSDYSSYNTIFKSFNNFVINEITANSIQHTNAILMQEQADVVIIDCHEDKDIIIQIIKLIQIILVKILKNQQYLSQIMHMI